MKKINRSLLVAGLLVITLSTCSQNTSSKKQMLTGTFAGSTPCNASVNTLLNIPPTDACAYMRWELNIFRESNADSLFRLKIVYGDFQPNTTLFLNGGKTFNISGNISTAHTLNNNTSYKILHLKGEKKDPELLFIQLDNNILHLIDNNGKLVKGDESHAFILNRIDTLEQQ